MARAQDGSVQMMVNTDLTAIKQIPILEVASRLGIAVRGRRAMCFNGHDNRTPSLYFSAKNTWKCFGACGNGGDAISLVREMLGLGFVGALNWFALEFGVNIGAHMSAPIHSGSRLARIRRKQPFRPVPLEASKTDEFVADPELYTWLIERCARVSSPQGLEYLNNHGIAVDVANRFGVRELRDPVHALDAMITRWGAPRVYRSGLAWGDAGRPKRLIWTPDALIFPFIENDTVHYVQGRLFSGSSKFVGPNGIAKPAFNIDRLRSLQLGTVVHICEGIPDAIALEGYSCPAVGILGANSFREEWVDLFLRFDVRVTRDGDKAGIAFVDRISRAFRARCKSVRILKVPKGMDVASVISTLRQT